MHSAITDPMHYELREIIKDFYSFDWQDPVSQSYYQKRSHELLRNLEEKEFRVTIVGEFSAGKSTFLNALIGRDILPHARTETTAAVTYIKNVPKEHALHNQVIVHFKNGLPKVVLNLEHDHDALKKYGTVQSDIEVVKKVSHVEVYVQFKHTNEKIVFIDTPGLNGVEEGHRELTLHEIEHAHASICLFHLRSLAHSNTELLKKLQRTQNSFLYVINFIDELKMSEGDDVEEKITDFRNQLLMNGIGEKKENGIDAKVFGVSSLKALAARDHSIPRLYHNDSEDLNEADRRSLFEESRFAAFEDYLWNEILLKEKTTIFYSSLATSLRSLLEEWTEELVRAKGFNALNVDPDSTRQIEIRLEQIKAAATRNKEKLIHYINSRHAQLLKITKNEIKEDVIKLLSGIESEIKAMTFEEMEDFSNQNKQSSYLKEKMDTLFARYQNWLTQIFEEIYQASIMKAREYIPLVEINDQSSLIIQTLEFKYNDYEAEQKIRNAEEKISIWEDQKIMLEHEGEIIISESRTISTTLNSKREKLKQVEKRYQKSKAELGDQPAITTRTVTRTRTVERSKWNPKRWFGNSTYEESYDTQVEDRSAYDEWQKKKKQLEDQYPEQRDALQKELHELEHRHKQIANRTSSNQDSVLFFAERIERAKQNLLKQQDEYENIMKKAKSEFLRSQQKRIYGQIQKFIHDKVAPNLQDEIRENIEYNAREIEKNALEFYERNQNEMERALILALQTNQEHISKNAHVYDQLLEETSLLARRIEKLDIQ